MTGRPPRRRLTRSGVWTVGIIAAAYCWLLLPYDTIDLLLAAAVFAAGLGLVAWWVSVALPVIPPQNGDDNK